MKSVEVISTDENLFGESVKITNDCSFVPLDDGINHQFLKNTKTYFDVFFRGLSVNENETRTKNKQKYLHDIIRKPLEDYLHNLGNNRYVLLSLSALNNNQESNDEYVVSGYIKDFHMDITVFDVLNQKPVLGIGCKNMISSYNKNESNYIFNLCGECNNILSPLSGLNIKYFNFYMIFNRTPTYTKDGRITGWSKVEENTLKYVDNLMCSPDICGCRPSEMLMCVLSDGVIETNTIRNKEDYIKSHLGDYNISFSQIDFNFKSDLIYNNPHIFIQKIIDEIEEYDSKDKKIRSDIHS